MSMPERLNAYLKGHQIPYQEVNHTPSKNSLGSAVNANIAPHQLAKAVVLEDHEGKHMLAILPTDHKVSLVALNKQFNASFHLLNEQQVYKLFSDCEPGAIPPVGNAYHINTVYDDVLLAQENIYLEAGDHQTLLHLSREAFIKLMEQGMHTQFSRKP